MPTICGYTWSEPLDAIIREEALRADVPLDIAYAIIAVESGFNPSAHNLSDIEDSVGLLQLNRRGGQGTGYTVAQLMDPTLNLRIGLPHIAAAFRAAWSPTIEPYEFIYQVATRSGHPGPVLRSDPRILAIARAWGCFFQGVGVAGPSGAPAAAAAPGPGVALTAVAVIPFSLAALPLIISAFTFGPLLGAFNPHAFLLGGGGGGGSPGQLALRSLQNAYLPPGLARTYRGLRDLDERRRSRRTLSS